MRYILSPIIIIILLMVILISIQTPDLQNNQNKALVGDYNFENVTISFLKNGKKEWELTASKSTVFNDSTKFYLENINGRYFGSNNNMALVFSSPTAPILLIMVF